MVENAGARARQLIGFVLLLGLVATVACSDGDASDADFTTRDSAGVRIVESSGPRWDSSDAWRVDPPSVTIGAAEGAAGQQLERVVSATRLSDGTIVVADGGARSIRRYDSSGSHLGSFGREGDGPGEFRALSWLGRTAGDSLLAWDRGLNRISVFTPAGALGGEYRPALAELPMSLEVKGQLSEGRLLLARGASFIPADGAQGVQRQPVTAWVISRTGEQLASIGPFPGESVSLRAGANAGSTIRTPVPFGPSTLFGAAGDDVYVVNTDSFAVRTYSADGQLTRIARREHVPLALRPEDVAADIEARLEELPPVDWIREGSRKSLESVPVPQTIPAARAMHLDAEGYLWIEAGRRPGETQATWSIFEPEGRWLGDLSLPASLHVLEIGGDYILGRDRDELDVQRVVLMRLHR